MKKCGKCGETKEKSEFYKDNRAPDKLQYRCKECHQSYKNYPKPGITEKECRDCKEIKPLSEYYNCWSGRHGKLNYCKSCASVRFKEYRQRKGWKKYNAQNQRNFRKNNPDRELEYDSYVANTMCSKDRNITKADITPEMIKIQRKSLKLRREYYKLKKKKNEQNNSN